MTRPWLPWILGAGAFGALLAFVWPRRAGASMLPPSRMPPTGQGGGTITDRARREGRLYPPTSPEAIQLFTVASQSAGVPSSWASDSALHSLLAAESGGWVGRPNYHFGDLANINRFDDWPRVWQAIREGTWQSMVMSQYRSNPSSATGLGQLTQTNIKLKNADGSFKYYPNGLTGIGSPIEEAIGMLRYIKERYGSPSAAWTFHQDKHWY